MILPIRDLDIFDFVFGLILIFMICFTIYHWSEIVSVSFSSEKPVFLNECEEVRFYISKDYSVDLATYYQVKLNNLLLEDKCK